MRLATLALALVLAVPVHAGPQDRDDHCHSEDAYFWYRPDQRRDSRRDRPEVHPRLPHSRAAGAGDRHGGRHFVDEFEKRRTLAQKLSPPDDPIGYRGLCRHHHEGPLCSGDHRPLPRWVPLDGRFQPFIGSWRGAGSIDHNTLR
jgi:hypothetical protein